MTTTQTYWTAHEKVTNRPLTTINSADSEAFTSVGRNFGAVNWRVAEMRSIEIIMCFDDRSWDTDFVAIPDELWKQQNTDDVVSWLMDNIDPPECVQIGVYDWQEDQEDQEGEE